MPDKEKLKQRFIGYYDILGFSEIINNYEKLGSLANIIQSSFISVFKIAAENSKYFIKNIDYSLIKYRHFSDTVLFYSEDVSEESLKAMIWATSLFCGMALKKGFPIRGCISAGDIYK